MARYKSVIEEYIAAGYGQHEPPLLVGTALRWNTLLLGAHGNGKTTTLKTIARAVSRLDGDEESGFRYFPCDKVNMVTLAGIPDVSSGTLKFAASKSTVFGDDVRVIVLDEVTRARPEQQNQLMEILEEKTCFGIPLSKKVAIIGCANPLTYSGTQQELDAAFFDRFAIVFEVGTLLNEVDERTLRRAIRINQTRESKINDVTNQLGDIIKDIRDNYAELLADENITERVENYVCALWVRIDANRPQEIDKAGTKAPLYVSDRNIIHQLYHLVLSFAAYYKAIGDSMYLVKGAHAAIKYNLELKLQHAAFTRQLEKVHNNIKFTLEADVSTVEGKLRLEWVSIRHFPGYMDFLRDNIDEMVNMFDPAELTNMIGTVLDNARETNNRHGLVEILELTNKCVKPEAFEHVAGRLESELVFAVLDRYVEECARLSQPNKPTFMDLHDVETYLERSSRPELAL